MTAVGFSVTGFQTVDKLMLRSVPWLDDGILCAAARQSSIFRQNGYVEPDGTI